MFGRFKRATVGGFANRRLSIWSPAASIVLLVGICLPAASLAAPIITGITPGAVPVGGLGFTLRVIGSGFQSTSVVQVNSTNRAATFVSAQELTVQILASDLAVPGAINITVVDFIVGMPVPSNTVQLAVVNAASPQLTSAQPGFITVGVDLVSMTLIGANFRPGATVVISPPLAVLSDSTGQTQAGDVNVVSSTVVNSGVMTALISVSPTAAPGLRAVDVLNQDGTSTVDETQATPQGSTKGMKVSPADSIGSPLAVLNMAMMHPRDGTVVMQGDELNAQAVLAGTGTGTVIGEWVWDGIAVEQFSATIVGGESTAIETRQSLPTWLLGAHTLQLRMLEPNRVASEKIEVAVNPGDWKLEQLIQPESGAVFDVNEAPHLLWAVVPGAMKYQVGFSSEPYLSTVGDWYDVTENQWEAPAEIWQSLPQGRLYWTVRTVDPSGEPRRPLPMRVLYRGQEGASAPRSVAASQLPGRMMGVDAKTILRGADGEMIPIKADLLHGEYAAPGIAPQSVSIPTPAPAKSATDAEEPKPTSATPKKKVGPAEDGQIANHAQVASGGDLPDTDVLTVAEHIKYQQGAWHFELNGSGLLNSVLSPGVQRTVVGRVNNYLIQLGDQTKTWGANLRFGIVSPLLYTGAQYVTAATPRQGAELAVKTPAGTFSGFSNTNDAALGGGASMNIRQQMEGASWLAPLPQWAQLRVMWLNASDNISASGFSAAGDVGGAMLAIQLNKKRKWLWTTEYAASYDNQDTASSASARLFGRAWRTGITGQPGKTKVSVNYHDVSANFGNPANPSLTPNSMPDVRGVNASIAQTTKNAGTFGFNYAFLANNVQPTTSDELLLNSFEETWGKPLDKKTILSLDARQSLTETGTVPAALIGMPPALTGAANTRDVSGSINLSRKVGATTLIIGGQRDWLNDMLFPVNSTITSSINAGAKLVTKGHFQLNSQASVNWVAANGLAVGDSRSVSVNLQPTIVWKKPAVQLAPIITVAQSQTVLSNGTLTNEYLTGQYGGRVTWKMPGVMKFSCVSAQGSYNQNKAAVIGLNNPTTQLLAIWTVTWGHKHTF